MESYTHIFTTIKPLEKHNKIADQKTETTTYHESESAYYYNTEYYSFWNDYSYYTQDELNAELGESYKTSQKSFHHIYKTYNEINEQNITLCYADMNDLDGLECCSKVIILDLSENNLTDISAM